MYPSRKMILSWLKFWESPSKINNWFETKEIFFILAIGRSGTKFFSQLLDKSENSYIVHEPVRSDFRAYKEAFFSERKAYKYFKNFRKKEIYLRAKLKNFEIYGEVNSVMRRHCNAIREVFPKVKILHLIRDGRDVVRSMMARKTMTSEDQNTNNIRPTKENPWYDKWVNMNRFEKLCWYWDVENRYLHENVEKTIYFEKLISDYEYFNKKLLTPLNLNIPQEVWEMEVKSPKNKTKKHAITHWKDWNPERLESFSKICGETMKSLGYEI
ncbi:MAG: sulfotransferase [Candidatus Thorarchaeota archaeon]